MRFIVWTHLGPFCYYVKLGANRADLVQLMEKFVQQSRVGIFCNEGTQFKSLDFSQRRCLIHCCTLNSCSGVFRNVLVHLRQFRYCMKLGANRAELVQLMQKFVQRSPVGIFWYEGIRSMPLNPKLMIWCVLLFGRIWDHFVTT